MMPPLAPKPRDLLLIGAPCPVNELGAGNEQPEYGNRVNVAPSCPLRDMGISVADFDRRNLVLKTRPTHTQAPPTRSAHDGAERDRLTHIKFSAQPNVAAGFGSFVNVAAGLES